MSKHSSAAVTVMSVIALVFGMMGMMASFIPCLGAFAFWIALPSSILAGIATFLAYSKAEPKTFALVALTISIIGLIISGTQLLALGGIGAGIQQGVKPETRNVPSHIEPRFSAFALSESTGNYGGSWNYEYSEEAKRRAVQECGVADCKSVFLFQTSFGALAQATDAWGCGSANTQAQAEQIAIRNCEKFSRNPETCMITLVVNSSEGIVTRNEQSSPER